MKKIIQVALIFLFALSIIQCSSADKELTRSNKKILKEAYNNKQLISIYLRKSSNAKLDSMDVGFVTYIESNQNDRFFFKSIKSKDTIDLSVKYDVDGISYISNEEKIKLSLSDNSVFIGSILGANLVDNNILFETQHKKYTIPGSVIHNIQSFDTSHVKLIFLDGSEIFGSIVRDDGDSIFLATILGEVSYPRNDILRIDYIK